MHDVALALAHTNHIHARGADMDAVIGCPASKIGDATAGDHGFGRSAAFIDASASDLLAFDECGLEAGRGERLAQGRSALAGPDDDGVVVLVLGGTGIWHATWNRGSNCPARRLLSST